MGPLNLGQEISPCIDLLPKVKMYLLRKEAARDSITAIPAFAPVKTESGGR